MRLVFAPPSTRRRHPVRMQNPDLIGWLASAVLIATLARQTWRQWREPDARGVSHWLFVGQIAASVGFVTYSWLLHNGAFLVTNVLLLVTAVVGQCVLLQAPRRPQRASQRCPRGD